MSLVLSSMATDIACFHQQQDDDGDNEGHAPPPPLVAFTLQLHDGVAPSPDRERRMGFSDRKTSNSGDSGADLLTHASPYKRLHGEVQKLKEALQVMRVEKDNEIAFLKEQLLIATRSPTSSVKPRNSAGCGGPRLVPWMHSITARGDIQTNRLGRHASLKTAKALGELQRQQVSLSSSVVPLASSLAERMAAAFLNPVLSLPYLHSIQFGADLVELSAQVSALLESEKRCVSLASPVYVFGDLHGNLSDLNFFSSHLWRFGFGLTAGSFLFLGDYVDRGASSLECVAYLFAHKLLHPHKVFLLRGNHETRAVNGLEAVYGSGCFLTQCRQRFGHDEGYIVWHQINHAFDRLPLAATIDNSVFCVHGGIPRAVPGETTLESIDKLPVTAPMDVLDKKFYDSNPQLRMVSDMLWGDPAREEHEAALDQTTGFGKSVLRGGNAVCFGSKAIDAFLLTHDLSIILRAHEASMDGISVAKNAKVLTIFSTSKDHGLGDDATCGCVLVDRGRLAAINRSPSQQQVVRRRRSITGLQSPPSASPPPPLLSTATSTRAPVSPSSFHSAAIVAAEASSTRRLSSHRGAYPSSISDSSSAAGATTSEVSRRCRRSHQDESSDTTDDEATSPPPRRLSASAVRQRSDNNQSDDV